MPIPTSLNDLQTVDSSNSPQGGDPVGGNIDDYLRSHAGIIARQFKQGIDLPSAATLAIPTDGVFFNVTGTVTITQFSGGFNGKIVFLRFVSAAILQNGATLITNTGGDITTRAGDTFVFACISAGVWSCVVFPVQGNAAMQDVVESPTDTTAGRVLNVGYMGLGTTILSPGQLKPEGMQLIGVPIPLLDAAPLPATDDPGFRYITLSAGLSGTGGYNNGVLTTESVSGADPTITATAVVSLASSPMNGKTVHLINTERAFLRPATADAAIVNSNNLSHAHGASTDVQGYHSHGVNITIGSSLGGTNSAMGVAGAQSNEFPSNRIGIVADGAHAHNVSIGASGGAEAAPRHIGIKYIMRIA